MDVRFLAIILACALGLPLAGCYARTKPTDINIPAPDFTINDSDHTVTLGQLRGTIVVLNFWATYCIPCIKEMPSLVDLQKRFPAKDVTIVAVSLDDDADDYHQFLKDHNIDLLTVREAGQKTNTGVIAPVSSRYGTFKIPETYVIDRNGTIRRKFINAVDWSRPEIVEYLSRL